MAFTNLRDSPILQDFIVSIAGVQKIGVIPTLTLPDIEIETETFRGGGMDGSVEIPMGLQKIEWSFDLYTYDTTVWEQLGYGIGSMDVPVSFYGYTMTAGNTQGQVIIDTYSLIKSIKTGSVEPGKPSKMSVMMSCRSYRHTIGSEIVTDIDVFNKTFLINGIDKSAKARQLMSFTY